MKYKVTDYHLHTADWSTDVGENGPKFMDYIKVAEENRINICFLEHFEFYQIESDKSNPFYNSGVQDYLEEIDKLKETYDFIIGGLEIAYYQDREIEIREFLDDYGKELDFICGSIHEWIFKCPVTTRKELLKFMEKKPLEDIINEYFSISEMMINSKIFKNVCHLDTIFRYINENDIKPPEKCDVSEERVLNLGRLCMKNNITIEYNLSGLRFPINRPFPSKEVVIQLKKEGASFYVGSDSHSLKYFTDKIPEIKEAYEFLFYL
jgi:histidinol-phosphatase (PHP family)